VRTGGDTALRASFLAVSNQHPYTFFGRLPVNIAPHASFERGLDAVAAGSLRPRQLWRIPLYALVWPRHAGGGDARVAYLRDVEGLEVECDRPVALQVDGEYLGEVERASVASLPRAAAVYVPPRPS
jgi:diacylglycerol kinase family enzyme